MNEEGFCSNPSSKEQRIRHVTSSTMAARHFFESINIEYTSLPVRCPNIIQSTSMGISSSEQVGIVCAIIELATLIPRKFCRLIGSHFLMTNSGLILLSVYHPNQTLGSFFFTESNSNCGVVTSNLEIRHSC